MSKGLVRHAIHIGVTMDYLYNYVFNVIVLLYVMSKSLVRHIQRLSLCINPVTVCIIMFSLAVYYKLAGKLMLYLIDIQSIKKSIRH